MSKGHPNGMQQAAAMQQAQARAEAQARYLASHLNGQEFTVRVQDCAVTVNGLGIITNIATPDPQLSQHLHTAWARATQQARDYAMSKTDGGNFPTPPYASGSN